MKPVASPVRGTSCAEDLQIGQTTVMKVLIVHAADDRGPDREASIRACAATIIEGDRHKKEPQAGYALGVGRSLLPHLGF